MKNRPYFKSLLTLLLVVGFFGTYHLAAEAQSCGFSSQVTANPTSVSTRSTPITYTITVVYPVSCQQANGVTAVQIQLRAFDSDNDQSGNNQRTVTNNTVSFNGRDNVSVQGSLAFFATPAYSNSRTIGLLAVYQASNNAQIFGTSSITYITTTAPPVSTTPVPTPTPLGSSSPIPPGSGGFYADPSGPADLTVLLESIITWVFYLAIPIAIIMLIWAGLMMLTASGNAAKFDKGKQILTYAVIGLTIIFIGRGFISLIRSILYLGQ